MLLLLLMLEGQQRRVLIDALVSVSPLSQAAIARQAAVPPSSLSRFRKPGGEDQLSPQKQDQLLVALGMVDGQLMEDRVHIWEVDRDDQAVKWLLDKAVKQPAELARVKPALAPHLGFRDLLVGQVGGARLIVRSLDASLGGLLTAELSRPLKGRRELQVQEAVLPALCRRQVSAADFDVAIQALGRTTGKSFTTSGLSRQLKALGMTEHEHQALLMGWLIERAKAMGTELEDRLEDLDLLELDTGTVSPAKMTPAQRRRLVENLSRRQLPDAGGKRQPERSGSGRRTSPAT